MKKLAVLTAFVFLFGMGSVAMADTVNYNDVVQAGDAAANDGGTAVSVKDNLNNNQLGSNNTETNSNSSTLNASSTETEIEDSYNTDNSKNSSTNTVGGSFAAFGSAANVGSGSAEVNNNHVPGETDARNLSTNNSKSNADNYYNEQEVEVEGQGNAATMTGDATADSRDQSTHTKVEAEAENGSLAAINTGGNVLYDQSTTISISNVGLALQQTELEGSVEENDLTVGGPFAISVTKSGETETGDVKSGKAESGETESEVESTSGSAASAVAAGDGATADANSGSESNSSSDATGGAANSGAATGGSATGGSAQGAAALATTTFTTGANDFTTGSFNGIATFNVNSGVNSLQQSPISVNAVISGGVASGSPVPVQ